MTFRILIAAAAFAALPSAAAVSVTFVDPGRYTDAANQRFELQSTLDALEAHIKRLGERYVTHGENVRIDILDIDLAGWQQWSRRGANEVRVARGGADWPMIRMRYLIEANGANESNEVTLSDPLYLNRMRRAGASSESLYYEKQLLTDWFKTMFVNRPR